MFKNNQSIKGLLTIFISSLLLMGCIGADNKADNPLIIPPNFNEMPDLNQKENISPTIKDKDIENLKDLLF